MTEPRCDRKGFTLIELLVVILILGVLLTFALPAYVNTTAAAKQNSGDHNARGIASALKSYAVKNGAFPTAATGLDSPAVVADMGGVIPNNPCSASSGSAGYTYTYSNATSVILTAKSDACTGYTARIYNLNL